MQNNTSRQANLPHQFSIISFRALAGLWITSPAAILLTTVSSSLRITPAAAMDLPDSLKKKTK